MARKIRNAVSMLLVVSLILALGAGPAFAAGYTAWINDSNAKVYTSSGISATLSAGTKVEVTAVKKGVAQISYKGGVGYVAVSSLTVREGVAAYVCKADAYVYKTASSDAVKVGPVPVGTALKIVGVDGKFYQVTNGKKIGYMAKGALSKDKPSDVVILASKVQLVEWSQANKVLAKGGNGYIYDIKTGTTVRVHRLGGSNHMELEPLTSEDSAKLLKMSGGKYSWDSRPVIFCANGKALAAAINTMPHGDESIRNNNYDGQFCMHFPGSKTHGSDSVNANHQAAIKYAYQWAQSKVQ